MRDPIPKEKLTLGQRAADMATRFFGSWAFIFILLSFILLWIGLNLTMSPWDPYPFILLNFILSCIAALQAPIILMSENREAERDRHRLLYDIEVNKRAEREIRDIQRDLDEIKELLRRKR